MGAAASKQNKKAARELEVLDGPLQDAHYPWVHLIQWSCEDISGDAVFRWNLSVIKEEVLFAASDALTFMASCTREKELPEGQFGFGDDSIFVEWALALLEESERLARVRYSLVPARLKEEAFWRRFFGFVKYTIQQHVLRSVETEEPAETNPYPRQDSTARGPQPTALGQPYLKGPLGPECQGGTAGLPLPPGGHSEEGGGSGDEGPRSTAGGP